MLSKTVIWTLHIIDRVFLKVIERRDERKEQGGQKIDYVCVFIREILYTLHMEKDFIYFLYNK